MKTKIEIKNRWTGKILFEFETENNSVKKTVEEAVKSKADLSEADLSWANLSKANLSKANLSEADLSKANLSEADLSWANLSEADLSKANLSEADLSWANLSWANLSWANLSKADLSWANLSKADLSKADLSEADLSWANLSWANLSTIKSDMFTVLLYGKKEVEFLRQNIIDGNIDGSTYEGPCACLSGTLMNGVKLHNGTEQPKFEKLIIDCRDSNRPIERFFLGIKKGDTPENNACSKIALDWVDEFITLIG